jgi:hypothetical protein
VFAQAEVPRGEVRLMWYNLENLFHPSDDSMSPDDEFTPAGLRHWTFSRYQQKLAMIAKVIVAAGQWEPPDIVGMAEIENALVLEDLVSHPILKPYRYGYLHRESPDHRGMDVACLFREGRFVLKGWGTVPPVISGNHGQTREILHLWGTWGRGDTLDVFLLHFISRYQGPAATAGYRKMQAALLAGLSDSIRCVRPGGVLVMGGDFNVPWEDYSMEPLRGATPGGVGIEPVVPEGPLGSYKYQGRWSMIDQFLVAGIRDPPRITCSVFAPAPLLAPDATYGGTMPHRTWQGYAYAGGISDHLPILLDIGHPLFQGIDDIKPQ